MKKTIYIQLLGEGTIVYRPVPAIEIGENIFQLKGEEIYDPDDEEWEFLPGTKVRVEQKELEGENVLVAIGKKDNE
ncbi:hypothetical protein [Parapedobacter tibetensis]|uniref:hypothetical protein n=1 Tax=Parapedobacter tibetensis TaxID=2972951 RepID=UPI00214DA51A|nr:hypothetical protein [Parapedobacter tibetensis]